GRHDARADERVIAAAARHQPRRIDERDGRPLAVRRADRLGIAGERKPRRAGAEGGERVVAIADMIDQMRLHRLIDQQRRPVDELLHRIGAELAVLGNAGDDLAVERLQQPLQLVALCGGHRGFGQRVGRVLVLLAMLEIGDDAELVERAAQIGKLGAQADEADGTERLQPDLVERRGEIVAARARGQLAEGVGIGHRALALGAKRCDRIAQLLDLGKAHPAFADPGDEARDARIIARFRESAERLGQGHAARKENLRQALRARSIGQRAGQVEGEHGVARDARAGLAAGPQAEPHAGEDQQNEDRAHHREESDDEAPHRRGFLQPHCARWRSRWSASTTAIIASPTGTPRMPTQGSWRPLVATSTSLPWRSTLFFGMRIELEGLTAKRSTMSWPVEMPPKMPPALFDRNSTLPSRMRISSAFSAPESAAAAKPAPISTAFTALMPIIAAARSASSLP